MSPAGALRVGVSSCLMGDAVRWNGAHKRDGFVDRFGDDVEWLHVCPEVEIGLGVPREPIELVRAPVGTRLVGVKSGQDLTSRMTSYARRRTNELAAENLDGYILKSDSPSCGLLLPAGRGMFADYLTARLRDLPIVEETKLASPEGRLHFVERMLGLRRVRGTLAGEWTPVELVDLAERHELQVVAHSAEARATVEARVRDACGAGDAPARRRTAAYVLNAFARALQRWPEVDRRAGALRRARNRLESKLPEKDVRAIEEAIRGFEERRAPFATARDLLRAGAERAGDALLLRQTFLDPEPLERRLQEEI